MITTEQIEAAVDYLRDTVDAAAQAVAEEAYLEAYLKVVLAREMAIAKERGHDSAAAQEREARKSDDYCRNLIAYREAVKNNAEFRFRRDAAKAKISAWQTISRGERL